jgi:hypothetical protein
MTSTESPTSSLAADSAATLSIPTGASVPVPGRRSASYPRTELFRKLTFAT